MYAALCCAHQEYSTVTPLSVTTGATTGRAQIIAEEQQPFM